jgi:hypothetical protein
LLRDCTNARNIADADTPVDIAAGVPAITIERRRLIIDGQLKPDEVAMGTMAREGLRRSKRRRDVARKMPALFRRSIRRGASRSAERV